MSLEAPALPAAGIGGGMAWILVGGGRVPAPLLVPVGVYMTVISAMLARATGRTKSSIYHHVDGKEHLLALALSRALVHQRLARLQAVQSLHQNKPLVVRPHENGRVLPLFHDAGGERVNLLRIQRLLPLHRHINILDCDDLLLHHVCCSRAVLY